jgi:hypothetical protein
MNNDDSKTTVVANTAVTVTAADIVAVRDAIKSKASPSLESLDPITRANVDDKIADTKLKKIYAVSMIVILSAQLLAMNLIFLSVGMGFLKYESTNYLQIFMMGTLAEVFGAVLVITRYLFYKGSTIASIMKFLLFRRSPKHDL